MNSVVALNTRDPVLRGVKALRDSQSLAVYLGEVWIDAQCTERVVAAKIVQTRYWPWRRARLVVKVKVVKENGKLSTRFFFAQLYPDAKTCFRRLSSALSKAEKSRSHPVVFGLPDWNAVVWSLPNGPRLQNSRLCFSRKEFRAWWSKIGLARNRTASVKAPRLKRYVARSRVLFHSSDKAGRAAYIKFYTKGKASVAVANLAMVNEYETASLGFRVPRLLAFHRRSRAVVMEEVPGIVLTKLFHDHKALRAVGAALAQFHGGLLRPPSKWTVTAEIAALRQAMADVRIALPRCGDTLDSLVHRIEREAATLDFNKRHPIHGNLFGDQILIDGGEVAIVDWDDLSAGDPLYDTGRLIAHIIYAGIAGETSEASAENAAVLIAAYQAASRAEVEPVRLRWHIASALLMRAKISGLRPLSKGWRRTTKAALAEVERVLNGESPWAIAA